MFPTAHSTIYRNEDGEVTGWENGGYDDGPEYCDQCGYSHAGACYDPDDEDEDEDEDERPLRDELPCGCRPHVTWMTAMGFHCETEDQGYCNFECPHTDEED